VLRLHPGDRPAEIYVERCAELKKSPPDGDWDGVWRMTEK
jgi:adenylate cyclase